MSEHLTPGEIRALAVEPDDKARARAEGYNAGYVHGFQAGNRSAWLMALLMVVLAALAVIAGTRWLA